MKQASGMTDGAARIRGTLCCLVLAVFLPGLVFTILVVRKIGGDSAAVLAWPGCDTELMDKRLQKAAMQ